MKVLLISLALFSFLFTDTPKKDIASFEIMIERNGDVVNMKCTQGCAWTELQFNLKNQYKSTVDSFGVYKDEINTKTKRSDFSFMVEPVKNGLKFTSESGTAWKELSYGNRPNKIMYLDERGISVNK